MSKATLNEKKNLYLEICWKNAAKWEKHWKSQGILSVQQVGNLSMSKYMNPTLRGFKRVSGAHPGALGAHHPDTKT